MDVGVLGTKPLVCASPGLQPWTPAQHKAFANIELAGRGRYEVLKYAAFLLFRSIQNDHAIGRCCVGKPEQKLELNGTFLRVGRQGIDRALTCALLQLRPPEVFDQAQALSTDADLAAIQGPETGNLF